MTVILDKADRKIRLSIRQKTLFSAISCPEQDLNLHELPHWILSPN